MKQNIRFLVALTMALVVLGQSCKKNPYKGYERTPSGLYYKIFRADTKKPLPKEGDVLTISMTYYIVKDKRENDSLVYEVPDKFQIEVQKPKFKGDLNEGLFMMTTGDSGSFIVKADSFLLKNVDLREMPEFIKPETMFRFEIKVFDHKTKEQFLAEMEEKQRLRAEEDEKHFAEEKIEIEKYVKTNKINVKPTSSGLYFIPVKSGSGPKIESGDEVEVFYKGSFLDGTVFDSTEKTNTPFRLTAGVGEVIKGWDEALLMMSEGQKAKIIVPSSLAYGRSFEGHPIPPYSTLIFEIEILKVYKNK